ncbi:hypothetical protein SUS17_67 [Sphingomonas sp. S17]|uniref:Uncharacterized protein n=2 Tax=Sphingomonas paucimobilis TaxID=13689 RepID=A0A7T3A7T2_SPHPI|nr:MULTISPECIES: hypothetical protein [Sphingomonas]EGI56926.1 hypothetical protein SUS17_67 [Sphingomonas sp. S17]MBQ1480232.1 hypothetical protein [Sphingomonas sp.]MCM3678864.1 hypothetical protein [Sphingomonas paucimobilis]MDG5971530.1 hypothetical protein [Sphingomonas paucimobilis]QBE90876.1 hypothetical protein DRN02_001645 [Sphingomonas paucimobilis]
MKKILHLFAVLGLSVAGVAATATLPASDAQAQSWRDGPRYDRDRDRRDWREDRGDRRGDRRDWRNDRRDWRGERRGWQDDRGWRGDRWQARREARVAREYDRARRTPGYVDPRSQGDYTNYTGRGSGYRPCTYVERNGRTVCR